MSGPSASTGSTAIAAADGERLDRVNGALMVVAAVAAWFYPFETFALAYVVLGPLHYLTQLSWLHDRSYFVDGRGVALAILAVPAALFLVGRQLDPVLRFDWRSALVVGIFLAGAALALTRRGPSRWLAVAAALGLALVARSSPIVAVLGIMVPTLIHVFVFTGAFVLTGALKRRSVPGLVSFGIFCAVAAALLFWRPDAGAYAGAAVARSAVAPFDAVRAALASVLGAGPERDTVVALTRFMAWAYTYHYLNWFSKTQLLRWHEVPRARLVGLGLGWVACLALYAVDYAFGFVVVGFVGTLHVFTEFPLDARVLSGLPGQLLRFRTRSPVPD